MASEGDFSLNQVEERCLRVDDFHVRRAPDPEPAFRLEVQRLRSRLEDVIEIEIGPRLVLLHRGSSAASRRKGDRPGRKSKRWPFLRSERTKPPPRLISKPCARKSIPSLPS